MAIAKSDNKKYWLALKTAQIDARVFLSRKKKIFPLSKPWENMVLQNTPKFVDMHKNLIYLDKVCNMCYYSTPALNMKFYIWQLPT